ncbi:quinone-dependent dihydroorotate dehydrogenase [Candidatus Woesearchaeota archaeon]|nr:quinone-dependent dihydroorotate dehydrogenase [Candidatus Woesearchaeota archaeon]
MTVTDSIYKNVLKPVFFSMDPEDVHNRATRTGVMLSKSPLGRAAIRRLFYYRHHALQTTVAGIHFDNPVGLAAGFDKNARLYDILPDIGFGFAELGSITGEPCAGNPRPRLFRVPQEKSIIVNYGLYNEGCESISQRLAQTPFRIPIGFSVAKTNDPSLDTNAGIKDYIKAYRHMHALGAYTTINVSCPNTSDGQTFGHPENLAPLLQALVKERHEKPIFLKIKPDMNQQQLKEVIAIVEKHDWVTGFIISNLTMHREGLKVSKEELDRMSPKGGLSGLAVQQKSNDCIRFVHKNSSKLIIGCGGIFSGQDAYEKFKAGAVLVQLVTGLIYEGPGIISKINRELVDLLQRDGYSSISELSR